MLAYLDNSATTRPTDGVIDAMSRCMREGYFNPSSLYAPAIDSEKAMRACREELASALCVSPKGIFFTSGGTEANNLAIIGAVSAMRGPQHLIVSAVEHPSVLEAFHYLEGLGHRVTVIGVDGRGQLDWAQLENALSDPPALVSCMQVNNETGALADIPRLSALVREKAPTALIHVDGVQGFLRVPFDARLIDLYTMSSHKIHGPKGVGALYIRKGVKIKPRTFGGSQEMKIRPGTEAMPAIAGFGAAARALPDPKRELEHITMLRDYMVSKLTEIDDVVINSPPDALPFVTNVSVLGIKSEPMLNFLSERGICVSSGSACSKGKKSHVLTQMNLDRRRLDSPLRISFSRFTTVSEIDALVLGIREGKKTIRAIK